jgi:acyl dehydratase
MPTVGSHVRRSTRVLADRVFTAEDQRAFAEVSGDANPLHLDPVAARRTVFGGCVVHGVHGLAWALDVLCRGAATRRSLASVEATFLHAIRPGDTVTCRLVQDDGADFRLQLECRGLTATRIVGRWTRASYAELRLDESPVCVQACQERSLAEVENAEGSLALWLHRGRAGDLFPAWSQRMPLSQLGVLLATTRLVGMECPGLHSLFHGVKLMFSAPEGEPTLRWHVRRADVRFSSLHLDIAGPGVTGTVSAFMRPRPMRQRDFDEVARAVPCAEFARHRVLVVGGSRGLGEVAAKVAAAGGAAVCVTYAAGADDAERVRDDITSGGGDCATLHWDVTGKSYPALPWVPTAVCYFATPRITVDKAVFFSEETFTRFITFYIIGFRNAVEHVGSLTRGTPLGVLYPSTEFLNEGVPNMVEYCVAKAAGEELCHQLRRRFPLLRLVTPRMPRMATDQTSGIVRAKLPAPEAILLPILREVCRSGMPRPPAEPVRRGVAISGLYPMSWFPVGLWSLVPVL